MYVFANGLGRPQGLAGAGNTWQALKCIEGVATFFTRLPLIQYPFFLCMYSSSSLSCPWALLRGDPAVYPLCLCAVVAPAKKKGFPFVVLRAGRPTVQMFSPLLALFFPTVNAAIK